MPTSAARWPAPFPTAEKTRLARRIAGTVNRLGSHESRHAGMRRNAKARISGAANAATPMTKPELTLCAWEWHESFVQPVHATRSEDRDQPRRRPVPINGQREPLDTVHNQPSGWWIWNEERTQPQDDWRFLVAPG
jgi:hypothetical protein